MLKYLLIIGILGNSTLASSDVGWALKKRTSIVKKENQIWVVVADTGIDYTHKMLIGSTLFDSSRPRDYVDLNGHGTHIAGIILYGDQRMSDSETVCPEVKLISCRYYDLDKFSNLKYSIDCVRYATRLKADYFNFSSGGDDFSIEEYSVFSDYINSGGTAYVAAGNERSDLTSHSYYPASYAFESGSHGLKILPINVVMNVDDFGRRASTSNYHPLAIQSQGTEIKSTLPNEKYGYMTGTSQATAMALHIKLMQRCKDLKNKVTIPPKIEDNHCVSKIRGKRGQEKQSSKTSKIRNHANRCSDLK